MARNSRKAPQQPSWGLLAAVAVVALASLVHARILKNPVPRQMELIVAICCAALALTGLCLKYRDRRKTRHQDEDGSNPK